MKFRLALEMQKLIHMKTHILTLILLLGTITYAKTICQIEVANPRPELVSNKSLNNQLKRHQQLSHIKMEFDSLELKTQSEKQTKIYFYTADSKKFESIYKPYNVTRLQWKIDFAKSQIFPQLFKNNLNIIEYNSKFHVRLYDAPSDMISVMFERKDCREEFSNNKMLTSTR